MALNKEELNKYRKQKEHLGGMLSEASKVINELNMTSASESLNKLCEKVNNDTFKMFIAGAFKNGKTTFINSLLGEEILPISSLPCTAVINEVKYGTDKKAILYFRDPIPDKLPSSISEKALQHMKDHNMKNVPPMEIPYDEIEDYVTIPIGIDITDMLLESPYEKVELYYPLNLLEEGVEIIDSPGLNEAESRTRVTMDYLSNADAILFVLNATALCGLSDMDFIEKTLYSSGFNDMFFITNRFDMIPDKEKEKMKKYAHQKLDKYTTNELFFVSAQQAIDGETGNDNALLQKSGMPGFVNRLTDFLTNDKGKIKLAQPARELKRILNNEALYKIIPSQRVMLDSSLDEVKARYEKAKPQLELLKNKKQQIIANLMLKIERSKPEISRRITQNTLSIVEMIPGWIDEFEPENQIGGFISPNEEDINKVVNEIATHVKGKIEVQQTTWRKEVLIPLCKEKSQAIFESVEADISKLINEIDFIRIQISGNYKADDAKEIPIWERIGGAVAGFLGGGVGAAVTGGVTGLSKELAKSVAVNFGGAFLLSMLGLFNPFTAIALIGATILAGFVGRDKKRIKEVKMQVSNEFVKNISSQSQEETDKITNSIIDQFVEVADGISYALESEISQVSSEVQGIIAEMNKGQANIDARKKIIDTCETRIKALSTELDAFIFELIEPK